MAMAESMRAKLSHALAPEQLEIVDDSHRHAGHAGARPGGETHFKVVIVAAAFAGKSRLERQRLVYGLLADEFAAGLHALQMVVHAPGEKA